MSNKPLDPFKCDGPGCTRSLRSVGCDAWQRLTLAAPVSKSYTFCTTACALAFREQRKRTAMDTATERKARALMDAFLTPQQQDALAVTTAQWAAWAADPEHNPMPRREVKASGNANAAQTWAYRARAFKARYGAGASGDGNREYGAPTDGSVYPEKSPEVILARARVLAEVADDDKKATMVERAKAHLTVIALEHAYDPMPRTRDLNERMYWQRRVDERKMRAAQWQAYLA